MSFFLISCTLVNDSEFYLEMDVENGIGYQLTEETRKKKPSDRVLTLEPSTLLVDAIFMPVKRVNFKVKLIHDTFGNIKESLLLEILTNGSISPKRALKEGMKIILDLFSSFFLSTNNLTLLEEIN